MLTKRCPYLFSILTLAVALFSSQDLLAQTVTINIPSTPPPPGTTDPSTCWSWGISNHIVNNSLQPFASKGVILNPAFVGNWAGFEAGISPPVLCSNPDFSALGPISWQSGIYGAEDLSFDPTIVPSVSSLSLTNVSTFCQIFLQPFPNVMAGHPDLVVTATFSDGTTRTFTVAAANGTTVSVTAPNGKSINRVSLVANRSTEPAACNGILPVVLVAGYIAFSDCGDERDSIIAEYLKYNNAAFALGIKPFNPAPNCDMFTQAFPSFNVNNDTSWELVRTPLTAGLTGFGVWELKYGAPLVTTSSYRSPKHNANLRPKPGARGSRHVFGDAIDVANTAKTLANWLDLYQAAQAAGHPWIEGQQSIYPCRCTPTKCDCVHADWRKTQGAYAH